MMGLPLAFAAPAVLGALILLPAIWWLLRLTPPRPRLEAFPPMRLLLEIARKEETPAKSPWWLTLLRLLLAALITVALAGPILRPIAEEAPGNGPLLLVVDNGWASARQWDSEVETARRILALAARAERPVALVATADGIGQPLAPTDPDSALRRLEALAPQPVPAERAAIAGALAEIVDVSTFGGVVWLSDGLGGQDADAFASYLGANVTAPVLIYNNGRTDLIGLTPPSATADSLVATIVRQSGATTGAGVVRALDIQGRLIGESSYDFGGQSLTADAEITLPTELRNDIVRLEIAGEETAGAVQLLDERFKRRRIGLLSGASADTAQPLLSPLYYISRAVEPFADIRESRDANLAVALPELIEAGSSVIAMADVGTLSPEVEEAVVAWIEDGGTLVRFAGPRLAATPDALAPVILREGDRVLGGSLSWETPQPLGGFSTGSPFATLPVPTDVTVQRQVLAEPDADLADRTWAYLADGTPLVTAAQRGEGWLILFHVTADPTWSNLPLSGTFVEMLRRIVAFSNSARPVGEEGEGATVLLPPYRMLDGFGRFTGAASNAEPMPGNAAEAPATAARPPGLYGSEEGFRAVNLLGEDATLPVFAPGPLGASVLRAYPTEAPQDLSPPILAVALVLLILDAIAVLWLGGAFARRRRPALAALAFLLLIPAVALVAPRETAAQPAPPAGVPGFSDPQRDEFALRVANGSFLAYVITGNAVLDRASEAGMSGLAQVVAGRTAFEPEGPIGVNVDRDDLSLFPLIYWPIDPAAPLPSAATMARVDAFMKQGGTVLFDTRDQLERSIGNSSFSGTPAAERLQAMLASLDIPPLEPVPADHVLTKTFYILNEFTGRYTGSPLWVEATAPVDPNSGRPVRPGDGVSSIMITGADLAAAWAVDDRGQFLYPTVPVDSFYREMAFRSGINILMYTLTGNYKADQVHIPAILERLGQ